MFFRSLNILLEGIWSRRVRERTQKTLRMFKLDDVHTSKKDPRRERSGLFGSESPEVLGKKTRKNGVTLIKSDKLLGFISRKLMDFCCSMRHVDMFVALP